MPSPRPLSIPRPFITATIVGAIAALAAVGLSCRSSAPAHGPAPTEQASPSPAGGPAITAPLDLSGLPMHNVAQVSPKLVSGAEPVTEADFAALQALGVNTIVSVDGATPNAELAAAHGMRYIHIPFGYDGVPHEQAEKLAGAYAETPDLMYIHCHHGKHRGPAGAMTALVCTGEASPDWAVAKMKEIGTSANYSGLYRDVAAATWIAPKDRALLTDLPAKAPVSTLAHSMAEIDRVWDDLALIAKAGWKPDPSHPDIDPPHQALILKELFHEIGRQPMIDQEPADFRPHLQAAETNAAALEQGIREGLPLDVLNARKAAIAQNCSDCHGLYRN